MDNEVSLKGIYPVFAVTDYSQAKTYYQDKLGFTILFEFGEYASLGRGDVQIHLTGMSPDGRAGKGACYITLGGGVNELYAEVSGNGAVISEALGDREYGMRDFYAKDLDGNSIGFGQASGH